MLDQTVIEKLARVGLTVYRPDPDAGHHPLSLYLSRIPAGFPSPADDHIERSLDLHEHLLAHPDASFFLRVSGDSMLEYGIHDGDLLIVDRAVRAKDGMIVVAALDGELTVKRLGQHDGRPALLHGNDRYAPIPIREGQGLVVWGGDPRHSQLYAMTLALVDALGPTGPLSVRAIPFCTPFILR
ncbi:LexA family protein [Acidithiobacillus acidisediminis]|uniref:LexA family protein n=1 Tax=Acidithiobacillus acidisediminis TaxID=2937799 RepID=UPI00200DBE5F|nr:translesion error-prone DNA polymerase V autoproteolytic subunit [Acidithiobacillus sp. S30A2]